MKYLLIILMLFSGLITSSSQDLILNGTFEDKNTCPEFRAQCAPVAWKTMNLSEENYMTIVGREGLGSAFAIHKSGVPNYRNYIKTRLLCPLQKDSSYEISFYVKSDLVLVPSIGILFSDEELCSHEDVRLKFEPNITFKASDFESKYKSQNWNKCTAIYKAKGDEAYLIMGNFHADIESDNSMINKILYCGIDDLSIKSTSISSKPCVEMDSVKQLIIADRERHTAHDIIIKRIQFKKSYDTNSEYRPIDGLSKKITPCAGDAWHEEYRIDTFKITENILELDLDSEEVIAQFESILESKKDDCIGITISVSITDSKTSLAQQSIQKGYDIGILLAKLFRIEKSNICVKVNKSNENLAFSFDSKLKESDRIEVLFLMK